MVKRARLNNSKQASEKQVEYINDMLRRARIAFEVAQREDLNAVPRKYRAYKGEEAEAYAQFLAKIEVPADLAGFEASSIINWLKGFQMDTRLLFSDMATAVQRRRAGEKYNSANTILGLLALQDAANYIEQLIVAKEAK